jgi:hypothetical protein
VFTRANTICVYLKEYVKSEELWRREALGNRTGEKRAVFFEFKFFSNVQPPNKFYLVAKQARKKREVTALCSFAGCGVGKKT